MGPKDQILARMYVVLTLFSLVPLFVAGRVCWIYITEGETLRKEGEQQASSYVELPAKRGAILDRAGRMLAVNTARYDVAIDPTINGFTNVQPSFFERLSKLTGLSPGALRRKVRQSPSPKYVLLARGLDEAQKEEVESWEVPGVILEARFARRYTYGSTAAHLLGHVDTDGTGKAGLELHYDDDLRGVPGQRTVQRDRRGVIRAVVDGTVVEPLHGESLVLTIDLIQQTILEEELARGVAETGARWGTAIAMDPHTGAILALANVPTYNPNRSGFSTDAQRRNHAITDQMEPGSVFKLVSSVAALERGITTLEDTVDTGAGWVVFHGRTMRDTHAYGEIPFAEVIVKSSNVGMAKTAAQMEKGDLYQYARNMGFGQPTWIDLPGEVGGTLKKPTRWSGTTLTSMSIGYEVDVTPLQLLTAYAALANGGLLMQPHLVAERRDLTGHTLWRADRDPARRDSVRRVLKKKTARALMPVFERVVTEGTAKQARVEGLRIAGKTGTARKAGPGGYQSGAYRATFVGLFPVDDPQVVMIVVMDEPRAGYYGGGVAAPVFQRVARRWIATFPKIAARIAPPRALPAMQEKPVPDVTRQPAAVAVRQLRTAGYCVERPEPLPGIVASQAPAAETLKPPGSYVQLALADAAGGAEETMPDLTGLSTREAMVWLQAYGVKVRLEGSGQVVSQSPKAGAALPGEAVLRCR
ncbi:MAG: penicillin-binding transpeptidase domain-containing protein [Rhodothermales bacterium]